MRIVNESNRLHHSSMKNTSFQSSRRPRSPAPPTPSASSSTQGSSSTSFAATLINKFFKSSKSNQGATSASQSAALPLPPLPASWQMLPLDVELPLTCLAFNQKANQRKNRYMDVVCIDQTRVKLQKLTDRDVLGGALATPMPPPQASSPSPTAGIETGSGGAEDATAGIYQNVPVVTPLLNASDYIHANHVDGFQRKRAYVCCQGVFSCSLRVISLFASELHVINTLCQ